MLCSTVSVGVELAIHARTVVDINIAAHTKMGGQRWWHFAFFYTRDSGYSGYDGLLCIDLYPVSIVLSYLYYSLLLLSL